MSIRKFGSCNTLQRRGVVILCRILVKNLVKSWLKNSHCGHQNSKWPYSCLSFNLFSIHSSIDTLLLSVPQKDDRYFFPFLVSLSWLCRNPPDLCPTGFFSSLRFQFKRDLFGEIFADIPAFRVICFRLQVKENVVQIHFSTGSIRLHERKSWGWCFRWPVWYLNKFFPSLHSSFRSITFLLRLVPFMFLKRFQKKSGQYDPC